MGTRVYSRYSSSNSIQDPSELLGFIESGSLDHSVVDEEIKNEIEKDEVVLLPLPSASEPKVYFSLLHQYAREGDLNSILLAFEEASALQIKYMVSGQDNDKLTPLHYACRYGHADVVKLLIRSGADVNAVDDDLLTPLHFAARYNIGSEVGGARRKLISYRSINIPKKTEPRKSNSHEGKKTESEVNMHSDLVVFYLVTSGATFNAKDKYGLTPLHYAAMKNNVNAARELITFGANVNIEDQNRMTALHTAAAHGSVNIVKLLVKSGANVLATDNRKNTALHLAARSGHLDNVKTILEATAEKDRKMLLNLKNNSEDTALHLAVDADCIDVVKFLLESGCNVNETRAMHNTPLHSAACKGYCGMVDTLLQAGADLTSVNSFKETPLHNAAAYNKVDVVTFMIQPEVLLMSKKVLKMINTSDIDPESHLALAKGEILEAPDGDGSTPFLVAVTQGHLDTVKALHEGGANAFAKDNMERSCIFLAAQFNCRTTLQYLLDVVCGQLSSHVKREFVVGRNRYCEAPIHIAAANGYLEICEILYRHHASLGSLNEDEETPMHYAARRGKTNVVKKFLQWNSKTIVDKDEASNTPLHLAAMEACMKCDALKKPLLIAFPSL